MGRFLFVVLFVLGLMIIIISAAVASADPWPNWNSVNGTFSCTVAKTQTSAGWDYTVNVDPDHTYAGWAVEAFAVYASGVTHQKSNSWKGYNGGNTVGWGAGAGWERNEYPGARGTTAAFGWSTTSRPVYSGSTAVFRATSLPVGFDQWNQHFAVLAEAPRSYGQIHTNCVQTTFWAPTQLEERKPPSETPEPASLSLLTLGAGAVFGALKRRCRA